MQETTEQIKVQLLNVHRGRFKIFILTVHFILVHSTEIVKKDCASQKMLIYNGLSVNNKFTSARSGQDFSLFASWTPVNLL